MANHHIGKTTCPAETLPLPNKGTLNTIFIMPHLIYIFETITYLIFLKLKQLKLNLMNIPSHFLTRDEN